MKKRLLIVAIIMISVNCINTLIKNMYNVKSDVLDGIVMEKLDNYIMMDSLEEKESGLIQVSYPDHFDTSKIIVGDKIRVYYTDGILESYPCQINKTVKIEKIE